MMTPRAKSRPAELICTVGSFAVFDNMYPPDDLCNLVFYTDVVVINGSLSGLQVDASWLQFKKHMSSYSVTEGGISFDARYLDPPLIDNQGLQQELTNLALANIKHYGALKILGRVNALDTYTSNVIVAFHKLKGTQGTDGSRRFIMAVGLYDYAEPNAWDRYRSKFTQLIENTVADTVIAISSTGWIENEATCAAAPTSVLDSKRLNDPQRTTAKSYPDLHTHAALVIAKYTRNTTRLGLSLEMGTLLYVLNETTTDINKKAYLKCKQFYLTQSDTVDCQGLTTTSLLPGGMKFGSPVTHESVVLSWEDEESLTEKLDGLKSSANLPPGMSWLLYDVHLGDLSFRCLSDPFERVHFLKDRLIT